MKAPNRFSKSYQHRNFSIENWFRGRGITNRDRQKEIMEEFLSTSGFTPPTGGKKVISNSKTAFIQNRFTRFCDFAAKAILNTKKL